MPRSSPLKSSEPPRPSNLTPSPGPPGSYGSAWAESKRLGRSLGQRLGTRHIRHVALWFTLLGALIERGAFDSGDVGCLVAFQQGVALEFLLDEGGDLQIGELQQLDRLTKLRRHHQRLAVAKIEARADRHARAFRRLLTG